MYHKDKAQEFQKHSSYNSYYGDYATTRVAKAIARKSWHWTLLNLAWTAGPVTFIAIYAGHTLGFGDKPTTEQIIYFGTYTLVIGLFAVLAGVFREALYEPKIQQEKEQLLEIIHRTYHLILHIRDLNLASLPIEERKIMAAYYTLQSAGCSASAVKEAVFDLTSNKKLSNAVGRISNLGEQGMKSLIPEIRKAHKEDLLDAEQRLSKIAPVTFQLLLQRMKGKPLSARTGRPRDSGFIQRSLDAAEENDIDFMTLTDAYELITLAFELLNGRKIPFLAARFNGDRKIEKAKKTLDQFRRKYREILLERNSAVRLILEDIDTQKLIDRVPETARSGDVLLKTLIKELRMLPEETRNDYQEVYLGIKKIQERASKAGKELLKAKEAYLNCVAERGKSLSVALEKSDLKKAGFYIQQNIIELDDAAKLAVCHHLDKVVEGRVDHYDECDVKELAMEIVAELDQHLNISHINRQKAIESSSAIQLGYLNPSFTPQTLVGWVQIVIMSMQENMRSASHQLAKNLMSYYGIQLTDSIISLLESEFGADSKYLQLLKESPLSKVSLNAKKIPSMDDLPEWAKLIKQDRILN